MFRTEELTAFALADFAHRTRIRPSFVAREMSKMASLAKKLAPELAASDIYVGDERGWVGNISEYVCTQADRVLRIAPLVSKVNIDLL